MKANIDRKAVAREYKARKSPRGIFALRCTVDDKVWVGSSMNLFAAKNALWFFLGHGHHDDTGLQAQWNSHGERAFQFEVLEQIADDVSALRIEDVLKERKDYWMAYLDAHSLGR